MLASIKAIDTSTVHSICSGQVIANLSCAVKELVENAIDAKATSISILFREYGKESFEVSDNGSGVDKSQFEGVTLKHHTSKIKGFEDVESVSTFGFRGEALSSLCSLGKLKIHTSTGDVGSLISYDHHGKIIDITSQARPTGTTVTIQDIFSTLPVRHKQFTKNFRKEFTKAIDVLQAYAIISSQRIHCTNVTNKRKQVIFSSQGMGSLKENIVQILGASIGKNLLEILVESSVFTIFGYVSKPLEKCGRASSDRQYIFINNRPCDNEKISKLINSIYKSFEKFQYPIFVLKFNINNNLLDVNVTPDKRKLFLDNESNLLSQLEFELKNKFSTYSGSYCDQSSKLTTPIYNSLNAEIKSSNTFEEQVMGDTQVNSACRTEPEYCEPITSLDFKLEIIDAEVPDDDCKSQLTPVNPVDSKLVYRHQTTPFHFSLLWFQENKRKKQQRTGNCNSSSLVHYKHQIISSHKAESELCHNIKKDTFNCFRVIGQFNLGFILVRFKNNMFIIDQHASDEKFRFETLQTESNISCQKLINPIKLNLNGAQEEILIENIDIFKKNGFHFRIDDSLPPGKKTEMTFVPLCKNWKFDYSDVEELLFLLSEGSALGVKNLKPSKVRRMFASQACRSAVMIGTALDVRRMYKIVENMSTMDHPWNCPHGRPTMRHVVDLSRISS